MLRDNPREIGSEFWTENHNYIKENEEVFLAGRHALDAIIKDILTEWEITSVLMPSYCCQTMIAPFLHNGIEVRFYEIYFDGKELRAVLPEAKRNEVFYMMKYFGSNRMTYLDDYGNDLFFLEIGRMWDFVIEDATHNYFHEYFSSLADYTFVSFRKWMPLDGLAIARKRNGRFRSLPKEWKTNEDYYRIKSQAFSLKSTYMSGGDVQKDEFLKLFSEAEKVLKNSAEMCRPNLNTMIQFYTEMNHVAEMASVRRRNAEVLRDGLRDIDEIQFLISQDEKGAVPLFQAVLVPTEKRDSLRKALIDSDIYCPVHWPISDSHAGISERAKEIYDRELSLICDQRYGREGMLREIKAIREFFGKW